MKYDNFDYMRAILKDLLERVIAQENSSIADVFLERHNLKREDIKRVIPLIDDVAPKTHQLKLHYLTKAERKTLQQLGKIAANQEDIEEENVEQIKNRVHISNVLLRIYRMLSDEELAKELFQEQKMKEAYEAIQDYLKSQSDKRGEEAILYLVAKQEALKLAMILHQDDVKRAEELFRSIDRSNKIMQANRKLTKAAIVKHVNDVQVGNVKTFEGMSAANQADFVNRYVNAREVFIKKRMDIVKKMEDEEKKAAANGRSGVTPSYNNQKNLTGLATLDKEWYELVKKIGDKTGNKHINSHVSEEEFKQHMTAFETHHPIAQQIKRSDKVVKTEYKKIQKNGDLLEQTSEQVKKDAMENIEKEKAQIEKAETTAKSKKEVIKTVEKETETVEKETETVEKKTEKVKEVAEVNKEKSNLGLTSDNADVTLDDEFSFDDLDDDILSELSEGEQNLSDKSLADLSKEIDEEDLAPPVIKPKK